MREPSRIYAIAGSEDSISYPLSLRQHQRLRGIYRRHGYKVELMPRTSKYCAGTFTQDTAFIAGEQALLTNCMSEWRLKEPRHLSQLRRTLEKYVDVVGQMGLPSALDGGEVVKTDREYLIGMANKTAYAGVKQIRKKMDLDMPIRTAKRLHDGMPHLGSGVSYLGDNYLLVHENMEGYPFLKDYHILWVPTGEVNGANVVRLADGSLIVSEDAPCTVWELRQHGFDVETVNLSEYNKAGGHISCLSVNIVL